MNKKIENRRQVFHLLFGILLLVLFYLNIITSTHFLILFLISFISSLIYKYSKLPIIHSMVDWCVKYFDRKSKIPAEGVFFLFLGFFLKTFFFPKNIAIISLLVLVIGDSISPLVGINFGKIKNPLNRSRYLEGLIAGFLLSLLIIYLITPLTYTLIGIILIALVLESLELKKYCYVLDDNTFIPLITGFLLFLLNKTSTIWPISLFY